MASGCTRARRTLSHASAASTRLLERFGVGHGEHEGGKRQHASLLSATPEPLFAFESG